MSDLAVSEPAQDASPDALPPPPPPPANVFADKSPIDGAALSRVDATSPDLVRQYVEAARRAQAEWAKRSVGERASLLRKVRDKILGQAEAIAKVVHEEVGKPEVEVLLGEVIPTADVVAYWSDAAEELLEPYEIEMDKLSFPGKVGVVYREPRGVVGLITPWNYPVALPIRTIVPALLAGNTVVWKPSEISPRSGQLVFDACKGILPDGVLTLVQGGGDVGAVLSGAGVDMVVFTGSVAAGRKVAHACAEKLIPCSLELGGKDAAIVCADANLDRAANGIVWGALTNAGQNCAAVERVYVEKAVAEAFTKKVVEIVEKLRTGIDVGPLATARQRTTVEAHVDAARTGGAKVLVGGESLEEGYGYKPTVLTLDDNASTLMQEETFGPVIPIATVASVDEAVLRANDSKFGLTASVWTKSTKKGEALAKRLRAGVVTINNHAFTGALPAAPWSGYGDTGYGVTNSPFALESLTRPRFVLTDTNRAARELWWYPYTPTLTTIALAFAKLRSGSVGIFGKIGAIFQLLGALPKRLGGG